MKAVSIKNPWAWLIAAGIKDIENRTWQTKYRGKIYIHASAKDAGSIYAVLNEVQLEVVNRELDQYPFRHDSAILGEVEIIDCVQNHDSVWAEQSTDELKIWNWVLANAVLYKEPVLNVKGKLSFWDWEAEVDQSLNHAFYNRNYGKG